MGNLKDEITNCRICADRFAATATGHGPRPVVWFKRSARVLIAGQAPGNKVHQSGRPFADPSGERLREWMGIDADAFYAIEKIAIVPMAFCFPGNDAKGADLPPPRICAQSWHARVLADLNQVRLTLLVGGHAQKYHLGTRARVTETVSDWRAHAPRVFPLPHPSWRNTAWLKKNPWFEAELLPELRLRLAEVLRDD